MFTRCLLAILVASLLAVRPASAQDTPVRTSDASVILPEPGATGAVVVATIDNPGMYEFFVSSGMSDVAESVEFRDASRDNARIEYITCPPSEATYLDAKGIHIFLAGLKKELHAGDAVRITLKTTNGVEFAVEATVRKP